MELKMKNLNIMGVHWKIWFLEEGVHKKTIYSGGDCLKRRGLRQFSDLREGEGLDKKEGSRIFEGGGWYPSAHYV